jgi:hypothetical protein
VLALGYLVAGAGTGAAGLAIALEGPFAVAAGLAAIGVIGVTMIRPTQAALLPQLVETPEELTAANVSAEFILSASLFTGPAIASLLLAASGAAAVVLVAGGMLLVGGVAVLSLSRRAPTGSPSTERVHVLGGFAELGRNRPAAWLISVYGVQSIAWGLVEVLIVTLAIDRLGLDASAVGMLSAALGVGALAGGVATVSLVGRRRLMTALAFGLSCWSVPLLLVGVAGAPAPVLLLLAAAGIGVSFLAVSINTLLQRIVPDHMLGRVFGLLESGFMGAWAIGSALAPVLLRLLGLGWAFVIAGAAVPLLMLVAWSPVARADREAVVPVRELEILRAIAMFALLPEPVLERLARNLRPLDAAAGTRVIREGEPGDLFYVVDEGTVRVTKDGVEVARHAAGDYFGEIALLRDVPRQATVTAATDVRLLTLDRVHFLDAMTGSSSAASEADRQIDRRLNVPPQP